MIRITAATTVRVAVIENKATLSNQSVLKYKLNGTVPTLLAELRLSC